MLNNVRIIFMTILISVFLSCPVYAESNSGHSAATQNHRGAYIGAGIGADMPVGPDQPGYATGTGWAIRVGYQFADYLALELGYDQGIGNLHDPIANADGSWNFIELPYLDLKPIIPINDTNEIYFLIGAAYGGIHQEASIPYYGNMIVDSKGAVFDLGVGYERYISKHLSLGGEIIYHHYSSDKAEITYNGVTQSWTYPQNEDGSATSFNLALLYHF